MERVNSGGGLQPGGYRETQIPAAGGHNQGGYKDGFAGAVTGCAWPEGCATVEDGKPATTSPEAIQRQPSRAYFHFYFRGKSYRFYPGRDCAKVNTI